MRPSFIALLFLFFLLIFAGCGPGGDEGTPASTGTIVSLAVESPTARPTSSPTARPTTASSPTATGSPLDTPTPIPTVTPRPIRRLPIGWQTFGDERFGLQIAAPKSWVEMTARLRAVQYVTRFGPQLLLIADRPETGSALLEGAPLGSGAFAFGFAGAEEAVNSQPGKALVELLSVLDIDLTSEGKPETINVNGIPGAYADVTTDPLGAFAEQPVPLRYRLLILVRPEDGQAFFFLMGAEESEWALKDNLFDQITGNIFLPVIDAQIHGHLTDGEVVTGALQRGLSDIWTFNGQSGRYATITLNPLDANMDLTLTIIGPSGNRLDSTDNGYAGELEIMTDLPLDNDNTYIIEVGEFFNESGRYELIIDLTDETLFGGGGRLEFGQLVETELVENGEHLWKFVGTAGQEVTIVLTTQDERLDAILVLVAPDGRTLATLDEGFAGDAEVLPFELPLTGEYSVLVRGFAGHGGKYAISVEEGSESIVNFYDAGDLLYGDRKREQLQEDEAQAWFFSGRAGDEVTITASPLDSNLDLDIWLLGGELEQLTTADDFLSGEPERIEYVLEEDGQYIILVQEFFGEPGAYEVSLDIGGQNELIIVGSVDFGDIVSGTVTAGNRDGWLFEGRAGERVEAILTPTSEDRDLVLSLVDPEGNTAITVDAALSGFSERLVNFILPASGEWTLVIREFFGEESSYMLGLNRANSG